MAPEDASVGESYSQMDHVMVAITDLPRQIDTAQFKMKLLQIQVPVFKCQKEEYNQFEHLLLNHIQPFQNKISDNEKLPFLIGPLRYDVIEFWQTLQTDPETTHKHVFTKFRKEHTRKDYK